MDIEAMRGDHAAEIIDFLEGFSYGNWQECLEVAVYCHAETNSALWLEVADGIRAVMRQEAFLAARRPEPPEYDDELPF